MRPARSSWRRRAVGCCCCRTWLGTLLLVAVPALLSAGLAFTSYDASDAAGLRRLRQLPAPGSRPEGDHDRHRQRACSSSCWRCRCASVGALAPGAAAAAAAARRGRLSRRGLSAHGHPRRGLRAHLALDLQPALRPAQRGAGRAGPAAAGLVGRRARRRGSRSWSWRLFQIGEGFVVLLAALRGLPREY